ncbi:hypothetical protein SELMODRAFT_419490 [Selaginella moellendorffii]|uniref:Uncharacterized protein n=1 Tax=Selaginella moellendorffii TaxID=88036 RepID=D8S942_SELML|nr:hypothetical protein SELMODRAFT_419490 [Selaginella moellendorffii]
MAELLRHPAAMCQVQHKIDAVVGRNRVVGLNFLHAIVKESLRLHPPSPVILYESTMPWLSAACQCLRNLQGCQFVGEGAGFPAGVIRGGREEGRDVRGQNFELIPFGSGWRIRDGDRTPDGAVRAGEAAARIRLGESGRDRHEGEIWARHAKARPSPGNPMPQEVRGKEVFTSPRWASIADCASSRTLAFESVRSFNRDPHVKIDMQPHKDAVMLSPHKYVGGPETPGLLCMNKKLNKLQGSRTVDNRRLRQLQQRGHRKPRRRWNTFHTPADKTGMVSGYRLIESREQSLITTTLIVRSTQVKRTAVVSFLVRTTDSKDELQQTVPQGRFVAKLLNNLFGRRCRSLADDLSLKFRAAIQEEYSGVKPGRTRLNFAYFPKEEFLCTVEFVADYAQRFLPLYEFDRQWELEIQGGEQHQYHGNGPKSAQGIPGHRHGDPKAASTQSKASTAGIDTELPPRGDDQALENSTQCRPPSLLNPTLLKDPWVQSSGFLQGISVWQATVLASTPEACKFVLSKDSFETGWPERTIGVMGRYSFAGYLKLQKLTESAMNSPKALQQYMPLMNTHHLKSTRKRILPNALQNLCILQIADSPHIHNQAL